MKSLFIACLAVLFCINLVSCGTGNLDISDSNQNVSGEVNININWNLDQFETAFIDSCNTEFDTQDEIDQCISDKMTDLINIINGSLDSIDNPNKGNK